MMNGKLKGASTHDPLWAKHVDHRLNRGCASAPPLHSQAGLLGQLFLQLSIVQAHNLLEVFAIHLSHDDWQEHLLW